MDSVAALVRAVYEGMRRGAFDERDLDRLVGLEGDEVDLGLEVQLGVLEEFMPAPLSEEELDRIMGSSLAYVDAYFPTAMAIGFAGRYRRRTV